MGHQRVGQDAEPRQHQEHSLCGPAAQVARQQQGTDLDWDVRDPNKGLEQENVAA